MLFSADEMRDAREALEAHLAWWGLKRFTSDADYFAWQRKQLSPADLTQLNALVERKRGGERRDEVAFYDLTTQPQILPVLYSQRYEYYYEIGLHVAARFGNANSILDFGCGVGILPTFYATQCPEKEFVGVDRSPASIAVAREKARELGLSNIRFECVDVESGNLAGSYDLIVATHALVQAEQDPGIPSHSWQTFERVRDAKQQAAFDQRTGIGIRLDRLSASLVQNGRMIVFEKTRQLARRVPFQRALAERGLQLVEAPEPIRYQLVEEIADDGPFYMLEKGESRKLHWDESPEPDEGRPFDRSQLKIGLSDPDAPLYENHWPSAQRVWEELHDKRLLKETTSQAPDGRQLHVELGQAEEGVYLYCANTLDQRQLVLVEPARTVMLESYYQGIASSAPC
jgi:SAM-dependent methyltransferase